MKLNRFGFNVMVMVWIAPVLAIDIVGNSTSTGTLSDFYYYKSLMDGLMFLMSLYFVFLNPTAKKKTEVTTEDGDIVGVDGLAAFEPVYCGFLFFYSLASWYMLHEVNKSSTGLVSFGSLIWSFASIGVAIIAGVQLYNLKGKDLVALRDKMTHQEE